MEPLDITNTGQLPASLSLVAVLGVIAAFVAFVVHCVRRYRHYRDLASGQRGIVRGRVVLHGGAPHAMRIDIDCAGTEHVRANRATHWWKETARRHSFHPFTVVDDDGTSIAAFTDDATKLIAPLAVSAHPSRRARTQTAIVKNGSEVWLVGRLVEEVSADGEVDDLRSAPHRQAVHVETLSTEPLSSMLDKHARLYRRWIAYSVIATVLATGALSPYVIRALAGKVVTARVINHYINRCHPRSACDVLTLTDGTTTFVAGVTKGDYELATFDSRIVARVVPSLPALSHLGAWPRIEMFLIVGLIIFHALLRGMLSLRRDEERPWYEMRELAEEYDGELPNV